MGLYKRGRVWWMRFNYNGRQVRRPTETTNKKLAEKIHHKVMTQIAEGKWFEVDQASNRTFDELAEKYEKQVFKEQKSWKSAQSYLNQLKDFFGPYALAKITPALIDDFKQMRKAKGVKPATINRQLNILRRMLNLARKRWLWMKEVPVIEMEPNADNKRVRYLSFEEYHRLFEECEDWLKPIVTVAAWTGLRQGNILNLRREQVNLFAQTITIGGSETKNGENLILPLSETAFEVLKESIKASHIKSSYVFCKDDGKAYYDTETGFLDSAGTWQRQGVVDLGGKKHYSAIVKFTVKGHL